jgi:hypothetical protein
MLDCPWLVVTYVVEVALSRYAWTRARVDSADAKLHQVQVQVATRLHTSSARSHFPHHEEPILATISTLNSQIFIMSRPNKRQRADSGDLGLSSVPGCMSYQAMIYQLDENIVRNILVNLVSASPSAQSMITRAYEQGRG